MLNLLSLPLNTYVQGMHLPLYESCGGFFAGFEVV